MPNRSPAEEEHHKMMLEYGSQPSRACVSCHWLGDDRNANGGSGVYCRLAPTIGAKGVGWSGSWIACQEHEPFAKAFWEGGQAVNWKRDPVAVMAVNLTLDQADEKLARWAARQIPDDHEPYCPVFRKDVPPRAACMCYLAGPRGVVRKLKVRPPAMSRYKFEVGDPVMIRPELVEPEAAGWSSIVVRRELSRLTGEPLYYLHGEVDLPFHQAELDFDLEAFGGLEASERDLGGLSRAIRALKRRMLGS